MPPKKKENKIDFTEEEISNLKSQMKIYADSKGFVLNPNAAALEGVIKGLLRNKKINGEIYCPCRVVSGNKEKDSEIICPCVYHRGEIELQGNCRCTLFWDKKKAYEPKK